MVGLAVTAGFGAAAAPAAAAYPADPFTCDGTTIFVAQQSPTQLNRIQVSVAGGVLSGAFSPVGTAWSASYNGISFNEDDGYIYGIANATGALLRIDNAGQVEDLGIATRSDDNTPLTAMNNGAFLPDGRLAVRNNGGNVFLVDLDTREGQRVSLSPPAAAESTSDLTYANGFLWGVSQTSNSMVRIDPATGDTARFALPAAMDGVSAGAAWTFGNGNLGFADNTSGTIFQVQVGTPALIPTFRLVAQMAGPPSGNNDGAACAGPPTDLGLEKTGPAVVLPGGPLMWELTVTNSGPGNSTGYTLVDTLPAGVTGAATSTEGCTVVGLTLRCVKGALANGDSDTVTVTATAPDAPGTSIVNTATVEGNEEEVGAGDEEASVTTRIAAPPTASIAGPPVNAQVTVGDGVPGDFSCAAGAGLTVASCAAVVELPDGSTVTLNDGDDIPTDVPGEYEITVTVTDNLGQTRTVTRTYTVFSPPWVTVDGPTDGTAVPVDADLTGAFNCVAPAGLASCTAEIELPDGSTVTLNDGDDVPTDVPGEYTVTATVQDDLGKQTTATSTYTVHGPPTVTISGPDAGLTVEEGSTVTGRFACAATAGVVSCEGKVRRPDGSTVTVRDGDPLPTGPVGSFELTVTVTDALGRTATTGRTYTATAKPVPVTTPTTPAVPALTPVPPVTTPEQPKVERLALRVTKRFTRTTLRPGQRTTLRVRVTNRTDRTLRNVRVCERVPAGLRFVSATPKARLSGGQYCWTVKTLRPGKYVNRSMVLAATNRRGRVTSRTRGTASGVAAQTRNASVRVLAPRKARPGGVTG